MTKDMGNIYAQVKALTTTMHVLMGMEHIRNLVLAVTTQPQQAAVLRGQHAHNNVFFSTSLDMTSGESTTRFYTSSNRSILTTTTRDLLPFHHLWAQEPPAPDPLPEYKFTDKGDYILYEHPITNARFKHVQADKGTLLNAYLTLISTTQ